MSARELVPFDLGTVRFAPVKSLWLWSHGLIALFYGLPHLSWSFVSLSLGLVFPTLCLGHSIGLHRGVIHETYRTSHLLRGVLSSLFIFTGLGGPIDWVRLHAVRDYHQSSENCPRYFAYQHSLFRDFYWNLHLDFTSRDDRALVKLPPGALNDRWLHHLQRWWMLYALLPGLPLYFGGGISAVALGLCARIAGGILGHWFIGYAAHTWGPHPHHIPRASETGTNVWLLGLLSFGEGFHNNHHAFPRSARMGLKWHEFDLGWISLLALEKLGLVWDLRSATRKDPPRPGMLCNSSWKRPAPLKS